jgi:membrane protein YqaA with SNARE-associated domain
MIRWVTVEQAAEITKSDEDRAQRHLNRHFVRFFYFLAHLGGLGLIILGVLDSSFLFVPFGNDLLVIALSARRHTSMPYYALMAAAGSCLGCVLTSEVGRKGGEKGLDVHVPRKRLEYVKQRIQRRGGWALAFASLMPPPFPFTPFVLVASALNYPRKRLLTVIGASRLVRFLLEGTLAIFIGRRMLSIARLPAVQDVVWGLVAISIVGSVVSVYGWVKKSRTAAGERRRDKSR